MSDREIITSIKEEIDFDISQATLTRIKKSLKTDAGKWYNSLMNGRYDFLAKVKESWDALILLQKTTWEEFNNSKGNPVMRNKYLNLNLRINEDIMNVLDSLRYIGELYPTQNNCGDRRKLFSQRKHENENSSFQNKLDYDGTETYNKTF